MVVEFISNFATEINKSKMTLCKCNLGLGNTGSPACVPLLKQVQKLVFVNIFAADGSANHIAASSLPLNEVAVNALLNQADTTLRWRPTLALEGVEQERAESIFNEAPSGARVRVRNGQRTFSGQIWYAGAEYASQLEKAYCSREVGVYAIDLDGSLAGIVRNGDESKLFPIPIQALDARVFFGSDEINPHVLLSFDWLTSISDSQLRLIQADQFGVDLGSIKGLVDFELEGEAATTTALTFKLVTKFGGIGDKIFDQGVEISNLTLTNVTDSSAITITGLSESNGVYTATWDAADNPTVADVLTLTVVKPFGDYSAVNGKSIVVA